MIGDLANTGADGSTSAGTWVSYLDKNSVKVQVDYAMS
jgi:hypothetical protein